MKDQRMNTKKKKKNMQPSSSRRESSPDCSRPQKQRIGCMSAFLNLLSRHHSRRRISSPIRKEGGGSVSRITTTALPLPQLGSPSGPNGDMKSSVGDDVPTRRSTCQDPRSPMLSSEIRRSGGCFDPGDSPRRSSALVAKLMGLEEPSIASPVLIEPSPESPEEKRRELLWALERCDEDLRALKQLIDTVRTAEIRRLKVGGDFYGGESMMGATKSPDSYGEQPSPVSVLYAVALSSPKSPATSNGVPKKACSSVGTSFPLHRRRIEFEGLPPQKKMNVFRPPAAVKVGGGWRWSRNLPTLASLGEAWEETTIEERKEIVGVGAALVEEVAGDLLEELVVVVVESCSKLSLLRGSVTEN